MWTVSPYQTVLGGIVLALLCGCTSGTLREGQALFARGAVADAAAVMSAYAGDQGDSGRDAVIARLELGYLLHLRGRYGASSEALRAAERRMATLDLRAVTSVSAEARAALSNPEQLAYVGTATDRVMAPLLRALNAMLTGDFADARPALVAARFAVEEADAWAQARADDAAWAARGGSLDLERTLRDPGARAKLATRYEEPARRAGPGNAAYVHPLFDWLSAVYRLRAGDAADTDVAVAQLRRAVARHPENGALRADLTDAEAAQAGVVPPPATYLLVGGGRSPRREEVVINLPVFLVSRSVDIVGVALPVLVYDAAAGSPAGWSVAGEEAGLLADLNRLVSWDFERQRPALIARSLASAAAKAAAAYGINESVRDSDPIVRVLVRIFTIGYIVATNTTDRRGWASLPAWYGLARVETPARGVVRVAGPGWSREIPVAPGETNIILVRALPGPPLWADVITFPPRPDRTSPGASP